MRMKTSVVELFVPRELGHVHIRLTLVHDRKDIDVHKEPLLELAAELLSTWAVLPDKANITLSITDIISYQIEKHIEEVEALIHEKECNNEGIPDRSQNPHCDCAGVPAEVPD